ncbi:hypothetical protein [Candidatus Nitrotoga arctica]|uniref:Uncharacterized protein n=1 Tax=Candidatus Nitrotoga arctica TaxID=453162 RepID=A0ABM8YWZ5_9PROT|nr:hypothetical protein [Candidatus Nitrotoga arctica]CAG9932040.1 protein of unknown function [Candidatus Nitrotoga arctica]
MRLASTQSAIFGVAPKNVPVGVRCTRVKDLSSDVAGLKGTASDFLQTQACADEEECATRSPAHAAAVRAAHVEHGYWPRSARTSGFTI